MAGGRIGSSPSASLMKTAIDWPRASCRWARRRARGWPCSFRRASTSSRLCSRCSRPGWCRSSSIREWVAAGNSRLPRRSEARRFRRRAARSCLAGSARRPLSRLADQRDRGAALVVGRRHDRGPAPRGQTPFEPAPTAAEDPAAIIFTSGSTGPAKGVLYRHGHFDHQVTEIQEFYGIQPGEIDVPCFPLFGLFNAAMGVTTVIPDMDASRPARVDPKKLIDTINDWQATQSFGSPAVWDRVGRYCEEREHSALVASARALGRSAGAAGRAASDAKLHSSGGRDAHALRRDGGPAGRFDRSERSAQRNKPADRRGQRRLRRPAVSRHRVEGDPHRRWSDPLACRRSRAARRRDRRVDRSRAGRHRSLRDAR